MGGTWYKLWLTPSLSIALLVESERPQASLVRLAAQLATLSRFVLGQPSLLRQALDEELLRGGPDVISGTTLRRVDHAYFLAREVRTFLSTRGCRDSPSEQGDLSDALLFPEEIVSTIAYAEGIELDDIVSCPPSDHNSRLTLAG